MTNAGEITALLNAWSSGDTDAADRLLPMVYDELRAQARRAFRGEGADGVLQPTALVHEAFVQLAGAQVEWTNRAHFFALAARMMRRLLINEANARLAAKRGGGGVRVTLSDENLPTQGADADLVLLSEAITKLAAKAPEKAELIELRYFGGLSIREMEAVTGRSSSSLDRDLRFAKAWLKSELQPVA